MTHPPTKRSALRVASLLHLRTQDSSSAAAASGNSHKRPRPAADSSSGSSSAQSTPKRPRTKVSSISDGQASSLELQSPPRPPQRLTSSRTSSQFVGNSNPFGAFPSSSGSSASSHHSNFNMFAGISSSSGSSASSHHGNFHMFAGMPASFAASPPRAAGSSAPTYASRQFLAHAAAAPYSGPFTPLSLHALLQHQHRLLNVPQAPGTAGQSLALDAHGPVSMRMQWLPTAPGSNVNQFMPQAHNGHASDQHGSHAHSSQLVSASPLAGHFHHHSLSAGVPGHSFVAVPVAFAPPFDAAPQQAVDIDSMPDAAPAASSSSSNSNSHTVWFAAVPLPPPPPHAQPAASAAEPSEQAASQVSIAPTANGSRSALSMLAAVMDAKQ